MKRFDTHAHLLDERFDADRDALIARLPQAGVASVLECACALSDLPKMIALTERYPALILGAAGVHPHSADEWDASAKDAVERALAHPAVRAVGEIGLDYHYDFSPREKQIEVFAAQLGLANDLGLPVIIHDREAHADTFELVKKYRPKGIIHCYSGSAEMAKEFVKLGMYIGFTGSVTFKNANKLLFAAAEVPEDRILLETDCPYMAPVPYRGTRCDSTLIPATAERLAEIRGTDVQTLIDRARENGCRVYGITEENK